MLGFNQIRAGPPSKKANPPVFNICLLYTSRLFRIGHAWVQSDYFGYMGIRVLRGQFPAYLYDSAVYLDAEKIFRLSGYGYRLSLIHIFFYRVVYKEIITCRIDVVQPHNHSVFLARYVADSCWWVPDTSCIISVSYTHLDVYKRQKWHFECIRNLIILTYSLKSSIYSTFLLRSMLGITLPL